MNITKFLRILLNESGMDGMYRFAPSERHVELVAAQSQIASFVAAYDALAPKPDAWPNGAKWYTIDADGVCCWHEVEPTLYTWAWESTDMGWAGVVVIPLGIDWRLCKWQRPEVTP